MGRYAIFPEQGRGHVFRTGSLETAVLWVLGLPSDEGARIVDTVRNEQVSLRGLTRVWKPGMSMETDRHMNRLLKRKAPVSP